MYIYKNWGRPATRSLHKQREKRKLLIEEATRFIEPRTPATIYEKEDLASSDARVNKRKKIYQN